MDRFASEASGEFEGGVAASEGSTGFALFQALGVFFSLVGLCQFPLFVGASVYFAGPNWCMYTS